MPEGPVRTPQVASNRAVPSNTAMQIASRALSISSTIGPKSGATCTPPKSAARVGGMDAFGVLGEVLADYQSFVQGFLNIRDPRVRANVEAEIASGLLWP